MNRYYIVVDIMQMKFDYENDFKFNGGKIHVGGFSLLFLIINTSCVFSLW